MSDHTLEILKLMVTALGIPAVLVAAIRGIHEIRVNTMEKRRENRHKQAAAAREVLKELFSNEKARAAMQMMDWSGRHYSDGKSSFVIHYQDLKPALRIEYDDFTEKEAYIRDCFESFFDQIELMNHYIKIDFLNFSDLAVPFAYYADIIINHPRTYGPFLKEYGYPGALNLFEKSACELTKI